MGDELSVAPEKVRAAATRLMGLHATLSAAASDIDSKNTSLYDSWTGSAANSMKQIWQRDFGELRAFINELTDMSTKLTTVADQIAASDIANSDAITQAPLPGVQQPGDGQDT
ncbi:WXG100 family type VII secretion target [Nocardia sp. JW2]|uniref:WXG100 family type VII secretion target n=1 Tax=Nocardia TaxID=1817 RepID=UPI001CDA4D53|nr:WXG100 family type VII secretion target [Nocardia rosealba]MCA2210301.1 WXG100 family type VII secretion target [Nocardia rosealba]